MYFRNAIQSLFWGVIVAGMSLIFQLLILSFLIPINTTDLNNALLMNSVYFLIIYALTEEFFKYFIVSKKIVHLSYGKGFIINSWLAGIGFSLMELFVIYQKNLHEAMTFTNLDILKTSLLHIFTFGILGYFLSTRDKKGINLKVLSFNFIIHFIYNYSVIYLDNFSYYITSFLIILLFIINLFYLFTVNKKLASD